MAARARPFDRPERDRPAFELPPERPRPEEAPSDRGRTTRRDEVPANEDRAAKPEAANAPVDRAAPAATIREFRSEDEPAAPDEAVLDEVAPDTNDQPLPAQIGLPPAQAQAVSQAPAGFAQPAMPHRVQADVEQPATPPRSPGELATVVLPLEASAIAQAPAGLSSDTPQTVLSSLTVIAATAPSPTKGIATPLASTDPEDATAALDAAAGPAEFVTGALPLDAPLPLVQTASQEPQAVANAPAAEPTGEAARPALAIEALMASAGNPIAPRAERVLAAPSARTASSPAKVEAEPTVAFAPVIAAEAGEAKPEPVGTPTGAPQTFGEHLAKVGVEALVQAQQNAGGEAAPAATIRADAAPPVLPAVSAAAPHLGPSGLAPAPASHAPAPAHPLVSGVPIQAVPVEIGLKTLAGINRFDIRLDPDDLGQIDVRLDISEGQVRAHIVVERPEALVSLQRETSQLERALEQAGFRTGDDGVSLSLRQQGQGETGGRGGEREAGAQASPRRDDAPPAEARPVRRYDWSRASGIDRHV